MSNYPNMSYCMNENTLAALKQVLDTMQEEGPQFLRELNRTERRAFEELFHYCESFLTMSEELQEEYEQEERNGQPEEEWTAENADFNDKGSIHHY